MSEERDYRTTYEGIAETVEEAVKQAIADRAESRYGNRAYAEEYDLEIIVQLSLAGGVYYRAILRQR